MLNYVTALRSQIKFQPNFPLLDQMIETMDQCTRTWPSSEEISDLRKWMGQKKLLQAAQARMDAAMAALEHATTEVNEQEGVLNIEHLNTAKQVLQEMEGTEVGGSAMDAWVESMQALIEYVMRNWPHQSQHLDMLLLYCKLHPKSGQKVRSPF